MHARRTLLAFAAVCLVSGPLMALEIGDKAPPLKISKWIKGRKFKLEDLKNKEIVVIDFWTSESELCQRTVPHLTEMRKKYEVHGVRFIGISAEHVSTVMNFVEGQGGKMQYTVAVDKDGATTQEILVGLGQNEIPHTVIVDRKGKIAWHGLSLEDEFTETLDDLIKEQPAPVDKKLDEAKALRTSYYKLAQSKEASQEELKRLGDDMLEKGGHDLDFVRRVALMIISSKKIQHRDYALALRAAEKANDLARGKDCKLNELCARVCYEKGDIEESLKYLRKALRVCEEFDHEDALESRIATLKKKTAGA